MRGSFFGGENMNYNDRYFSIMKTIMDGMSKSSNELVVTASDFAKYNVIDATNYNDRSIGTTNAIRRLVNPINDFVVVKNLKMKNHFISPCYSSNGDLIFEFSSIAIDVIESRKMIRNFGYGPETMNNCRFNQCGNIFIDIQPATLEEQRKVNQFVRHIIRILANDPFKHNKLVVLL